MHSMAQKLFNLPKELRKYWKAFSDKYVFDDGQSYFMLLCDHMFCILFVPASYVHMIKVKLG
jgi:hypothetical protein